MRDLVGSDVTLAASPNCFRGFNPFLAYEVIASLGIHFTELLAEPFNPSRAEKLPSVLMPEVMTPAQVEALLARFDTLGLAAFSVGAYCDLLVDAEVTALLGRIDFAKAVGASIVVSYATPQDEVSEMQERRLINVLRYAGDYASSQGISIALEIRGRTRNASLALTLVRAVEHPAVGVNYDTGNVHYYNGRADDQAVIAEMAGHVFQVHLKDTSGGIGEWKFCALGEGAVELPAIISSLQEGGFSGPYMLEVEGVEGEDLPLSGHRRRLEESIAYLEALGFTR